MAKKPGSGEYDVGHGKPPTHSQWKKGQSGNPSGKTSKAASIEAKLKKLAAEEIVVIKNGTPVSMTQDEAMLVAVLMKAMKGDMAAVKFVTETLGSGETTAVQPPSLKVTAADLKVLESRAAWMGILEAARAQSVEAQEDAARTVENDDEAI